jgi:hypothetical protein
MAGGSDIAAVVTALANLANMDLAISSLRDALLGTSSKTLTDIDGSVAGLTGSGNKDFTDLDTGLGTVHTDLTTLAGAKTLADIVTELTTLAGAKTLADIVTALANIANLDIATSALRDALRGTGDKTLADIVSEVSTLANGSDIAAVVTALANIANLDITTSALRDALAGSGAGAKTLADIVSAIIGQLQTKIINSDGTRTVYVQQALGDEETFVNALATSGFLLQYDPVSGFWKRFTGKVSANLQVGDNDVEDANPVPVQQTGSNTLKTATATVTIGTGAAHHAGDVVAPDAGAIIEFETGLAAGGSGCIVGSLVWINQNAVFSSGAGYTLPMFNASPTVQPTNEAYNLSVADAAKYIDDLNISTLVDKGDTCKASESQAMFFDLAAADTKLYGKLVCVGGETTVSEVVITIVLLILPV